MHFNKIGYKLYRKEQSRRVPSYKAKPGSPGYGFLHACRRDVLNDDEDRLHCENLLRRSATSSDRTCVISWSWSIFQFLELGTLVFDAARER